MLSRDLANEVYALMKNPADLDAWYRFLPKVQGDSWHQCWIWLAGKTHEGYGRFIYRYRNRGAHSLMAKWVYGEPEEGTPATGGLRIVVDHLVCNNPSCVNPLHLRFCTDRENTLRNSSPISAYRRSTHCPKGHERTPENQSQSHKNYYGEHVRACLECKRERGKIWAAKKYEKSKEKMQTLAREWQRKNLANPEERERNRQLQRERYAKRKNNPEYMAKKNAYNQEWYRKKQERRSSPVLALPAVSCDTAPSQPDPTAPATTSHPSIVAAPHHACHVMPLPHRPRLACGVVPERATHTRLTPPCLPSTPSLTLSNRAPSCHACQDSSCPAVQR